MVGWFSVILLAPLEVLQHGLTREIRYINAFGLAAALLAGVSLLLRPDHSNDQTDPA